MTDKIQIRAKIEQDLPRIKALMLGWGGEPLVVRAKSYYPTRLEGLFAMRGNELMGFLFYDIQDEVCEIIVFEVYDKFQGIGSRLLETLKSLAKMKGCQKLLVMTTNDHLDALRFYQRRGFVIARIHIDSVKHSRSIKPGIPLIGELGIPLRDEIDLEAAL